MAAGGYGWWYVDALSDCGRHGLTIIVFVGSVFSPYYAWARRRGEVDPLDHCTVNVALYGTHPRWAMTERGRRSLRVLPERIDIGPSSAAWDGSALTIRIDERTMPGQRRLRGVVRVEPAVLIDHEVMLDPEGIHLWRPFAPAARVSATFEHPALCWSGAGYFDSNFGTAPLEDGFSRWSWSRLSLGDETLVLYDAVRRDGSLLELAQLFAVDGAVRDVAAPPLAPLPRGFWGVAGPTRADAGTRPVLLRRLEDAPFYTRSEIAATLLGARAHGVHESLDLDRFRSPVVKLMLPCRMPRRARS